MRAAWESLLRDRTAGKIRTLLAEDDNEKSKTLTWFKDNNSLENLEIILNGLRAPAGGGGVAHDGILEVENTFLRTWIWQIPNAKKSQTVPLPNINRVGKTGLRRIVEANHLLSAGNLIQILPAASDHWNDVLYSWLAEEGNNFDLEVFKKILPTVPERGRADLARAWLDKEGNSFGSDALEKILLTFPKQNRADFTREWLAEERNNFDLKVFEEILPIIPEWECGAFLRAWLAKEGNNFDLRGCRKSPKLSFINFP